MAAMNTSKDSKVQPKPPASASADIPAGASASVAGGAGSDSVSAGVTSGVVASGTVAAAAAKKAKPVVDLSKMDPEARKKFEALTAQVEANRKASLELKRQAAAISGVPLVSRSVADKMGNLSGDLIVSAELAGFREAGSKTMATKIGETGIKLSEALKIEGVSQDWVRANFARGALKINGRDFVEAVNTLVGTAPPTTNAETGKVEENKVAA